MKSLISTTGRRLAWAFLSMILGSLVSFWIAWLDATTGSQTFTPGELMNRLIAIPVLLAAAVLALTTACAIAPQPSIPMANGATPTIGPTTPFVAQVVGLQWLNPLQRKDYPTEWQLLWTLGLARANAKDSYVETNPTKYAKLQAIGIIANGYDGEETMNGFHHKYVERLFTLYHDVYFSSSEYFYNVHTRDTRRWRELAGIHVEYALPKGRLDAEEVTKFTREIIVDTFDIGSVNFPTLWTRNTPPDVRVTMGGANAGFTSLSAALDHLQSHPKETVWVMNWDAPNFPPKDEQINENMVLLILAGSSFNTERDPLAWIGYPSVQSTTDFEAKKGQPPRVVQALNAAMQAAAHNAGKQDTDIAYVIHDANTASDRIGSLAQTLTTELPEFDFLKQTFNTPALLGDMGAGTALTNVALAIGYANHLGKNVLVAGTTDADHPTAVMVLPPAKVRPIDPAEDWFRARSGRHAFLPWWGLRHDAPPDFMQGYSE